MGQLSTKQLERINVERDSKKREMTDKNMRERIDDGMRLLDEMKHETSQKRRKVNQKLFTRQKRGVITSKVDNRKEPYKKSILRRSLDRSADDDLGSIMSEWNLEPQVEEILYGGSAGKRRAQQRRTPTTIGSTGKRQHSKSVTITPYLSYDEASLRDGDDFIADVTSPTDLLGGVTF